jgi:16S rRNA (cytosine1402-N4)-methyltransferase
VGAEQREHQPVLVEQVLHLLEPRPGDVILDGTVGLGGHAAALLPHIMPSGRYVGLDLDEEMLKGARARLGEGVELHQANFASFPEVLVRAGVRQVDRMLLDLGVNSVQLEDAARGFSFGRDGPLDMRYDRRQELLALDLVNRLSERELADVFYHNGQEPGSRKVAKRICQVRHEGRITSTLALARAVESAYAMSGRRGGRIHPATRVFMALRIEVNHELDNLREFLRQVPEFLRPGGRLAVISFHSLEDGIVKQFLRAAKAAGTLQEITRRPVVADPQERTGNPRSRSAKLRVAVRQEEPAQQGGSDGPE